VSASAAPVRPAGPFGFDPEAAVAHLRSVDPTLARLIDAVGPFGMRPIGTSTLFAALTQSIVYQQLNGKAAATIHGRLCALFPRAKAGPSPRHILGASDEALRGAGLSRGKLLSLRDLAQKTEAGIVPTLAELAALDDDAIVERLTEVRGIGRWTVEMLLMFRLGRPDVLPTGDYGVRKGFALTFKMGTLGGFPTPPAMGKAGRSPSSPDAFKKVELPAPAELETRGARWRPYRTVASWYLWRAIELATARASAGRG